MKFENAFRDAREAGSWPIFARYEYFKARAKTILHTSRTELSRTQAIELANEIMGNINQVNNHSKHWLGILRVATSTELGWPDHDHRWNLDMFHEQNLKDILERSLLLRADLATLMGYCQMNSCAFNRIGKRLRQYWNKISQHRVDDPKVIDSNLMQYLKPGILNLVDFLERTIYSTSRRMALRYDTGSGPISQLPYLSAATQRVDVHRVRKCTRFLEQDGQYILHELTRGEYCHQIPLAYAIKAGHQGIANAMIQKMIDISRDSIPFREEVCGRLRQLAKLAIQIDNFEMFKVLIWSENEKHFDAVDNESLLMVAARTGRERYVKALLDDFSFHRKTIDNAKNFRRWSALFFACAEGHINIVELLVYARAECSIKDANGWTARELAAYRGHIAIAEMLPKNIRPARSLGGELLTSKLSSLHQLKLDIWNDPEGSGRNPTILRLGSADTLNPVSFINLPNFPHDLTSGLTVIIKLDGKYCSDKVALPLLGDWEKHPAVLWTRDPDLTKIFFKIGYDDLEQGSHGDLVTSSECTFGDYGSAAMLNEIRRDPAPRRDSLVRDYEIPIVELYRSDYVGSLVFNFLILKPFLGERTLSGAQHDFWKLQNRPCIVGHMDFKQDVVAEASQQREEHGLPVYRSMHTHQAFCVEVDVQVTGDGHPIIYHHLSMEENNLRSQISNMMQEKFLRMVGPGEPHPTLKDFLTKFRPWSTAFDLRLVYPMLWELRDQGLHPTALEINYFVDCILDTIFNHGGQRNITLSSSTPEVCMALAYKQRTYPILFVTEAGDVPVSEPCAASLQRALHFAKKCGLNGIVASVEPFRNCPRLIGYIKHFQLVCGARVEGASDAELIRMLRTAGVDLIVTKNPRFVAECLGSVGMRFG
ncbi:MAG: hypothetical protein M1831_005204 [Alyxoria varia]|nr:MAG: hypothetical protein M1831_005204 [Alyxoria varia]